MKISFVSDNFSNNDCFSATSPKNRDNYLAHIQKLKKIFNEAGINLSTSDINKPDLSNAVLQSGLKVKRLKKKDKENYYLIALESPLIDNAAISTKYHDKFNKIFTWNDDLIDDKKYFKVNDALVFSSKILKEFDGKKLCCIIARNKHSKYPNFNELYT